jgi:hypothetical protein
MSSNLHSIPEVGGAVTIRHLSRDDIEAAEWLAQVDTRRLPSGELLGAEVDGRLLGVISLSTGESVADPFSRTDELRAMLELRAEQLRRRTRTRGLPTPRRRRARARLSLAGSPPGIPRWLMNLADR